MSQKDYIVLTLKISSARPGEGLKQWNQGSDKQWVLAGGEPRELCRQAVTLLNDKGWHAVMDWSRSSSPHETILRAQRIVRDKKANVDQFSREHMSAFNEVIAFLEKGFTDGGYPFMVGWKDVEQKGELLAERHALDVAAKRTEAKRETRRL